MDGPRHRVWVRRSIKCSVEACRFHGRDAVRKRLARTDPPWPFYLRREIALYEAFATVKLPVRVPRMFDADPKRGFIVLERVRGEPLAPRRHSVPDDRATWHALIRVAHTLRTVRACRVDVRATQEDRRVMRARLLEDPTSPRRWMTSGLRACALRGLIGREVADGLARDIKRTAFQHGDLLLRNVLRDEAGLVLIDWECAGLYGEGWDAALLSVFAPNWARPELARGLDPRSFRACFVFALLREIVFRRGKDDEIMRRLRDDLELALTP